MVEYMTRISIVECFLHSYVVCTLLNPKNPLGSRYYRGICRWDPIIITYVMESNSLTRHISAHTHTHTISLMFHLSLYIGLSSFASLSPLRCLLSERMHLSALKAQSCVWSLSTWVFLPSFCLPPPCLLQWLSVCQSCSSPPPAAVRVEQTTSLCPSDAAVRLSITALITPAHLHGTHTHLTFHPFSLFLFSALSFCPSLTGWRKRVASFHLSLSLNLSLFLSLTLSVPGLTSLPSLSLSLTLSACQGGMAEAGFAHRAHCRAFGLHFQTIVLTFHKCKAKLRILKKRTRMYWKLCVCMDRERWEQKRTEGKGNQDKTDKTSECGHSGVIQYVYLHTDEWCMLDCTCLIQVKVWFFSSGVPRPVLKPVLTVK